MFVVLLSGKENTVTLEAINKKEKKTRTQRKKERKKERKKRKKEREKRKEKEKKTFVILSLHM